MQDTLVKLLSTFILICVVLVNAVGNYLGVGDIIPTDPGTTASETTTVGSDETTAVQIPESTTKVPSTTSGDNKNGSFVFKVYGFGHGVGMSQEGAIKMAKDGKGYEEILTHYYTGTTVKTDYSTPLTVRYGGNDIPIVEYLCRTTKREIGSSAPLEALKAQVVTAYTYAKYYDFDVKSSLHAYDKSYDYKGTNIHKACLDVLGMSDDYDTPGAKYVDYNGKAALTCYFASAAGKTTNAKDVWGGSGYPYLVGGVSSPEAVDATEVTISAEEMKALIEEYASDNGKNIILDDDPAKWLEIISHDSSYSENAGYVAAIRVGNIELRGNAFRSYVVDFKIRSHCFTFEYIS